MIIAEVLGKCKTFLRGVSRDLLILVILLLAALMSFGLGYLTGLDVGRAAVSVTSFPAAPLQEVVASKSGTKYFLPWCAGAERISATNKVTFASADEAEAAGYASADNCGGLSSVTIKNNE